MPQINHYLATANPNSSKAISQKAKENPSILNLSIGEPDFGPPPHLLEDIGGQDLQLSPFIDAMKRYEHSRGSPELRRTLAEWYRRRHGVVFDPECEIMITHGGIEALNLALLAVTDPADRIAIADPAYMLYERIIHVLGREVVVLPRPSGEHEYAAGLNEHSLQGAKALLVNSPENPTGYVISDEDWRVVSRIAERDDSWVIHDEVYDTMAFARAHRTARSVPGLERRGILVNSCSKKFGMPGLRIGWLIAPPEVIQAASRVHESLCLGVNILSERIANRLLGDATMEAWFEAKRLDMAARNQRGIALLSEEMGYQWPRAPMGGMFLFPDVRELHRRLPARYRETDQDVGTQVAHYLLNEYEIAAVPGGLYGRCGRDHIRLTNCGPASIFDAAILRLAGR